jgi:hypothetical protein
LHQERIDAKLNQHLKTESRKPMGQYLVCVKDFVESATVDNFKSKVDEIKKASIKIFTLRDRSCNIQNVKELAENGKENQAYKI